MSQSVRTRCKGRSTACGESVCAQLTARRQAFLIRSTSSKIWALVGPHYHSSCALALHIEPKRNRRRSKIAVRCRRTRGRSEQRCQNLSASRGCSRAQVHRRTQDNGFDCHASIRVSGSKKRLRGTQSAEREYHVDHTPRN